MSPPQLRDRSRPYILTAALLTITAKLKLSDVVCEETVVTYDAYPNSGI